jgi:hypothetical protein
MNIDTTLNAFKIPGMSGINFPFGVKNPNNVPIWDDEAVTNAALPFLRQRPFIVDENSTTMEIQAHSVFVMQDDDLSLILGAGGFIGCEVRVINISEGHATITYSESEKILKAGEEFKLEWDGTVWKVQKGGSDGVNTPDGFGQYQDGRNLLEVLDVETPAEAMAILQERCNNGDTAANGEPDFSGLQIGDYIPGIDLSAIPAENSGTAGQAYSEEYHNNDIVISGFNTYLGAGDTENTKNHILFTFRNCPINKRMNSSNDNTGGYQASELRAFLEGTNGDGTGDKSGVTTAAFMNALKAQIGDVLYKIRTYHSTKASQSWNNYTVFLPTEIEVFGFQTYGNEIVGSNTNVQFPIFQKSYKHRIKRSNGARQWWWEHTPYSGSASTFCGVNGNGNTNNNSASSVGGCAPAFCVA